MPKVQPKKGAKKPLRSKAPVEVPQLTSDEVLRLYGHHDEVTDVRRGGTVGLMLTVMSTAGKKYSIETSHLCWVRHQYYTLLEVGMRLFRCDQRKASRWQQEFLKIHEGEP